MNPTIASYLEQGRQLEARGDVVGAIKLYSGLLKTAPDEAAVHVQLASCYDRIGRTSDAVKYLQHVRGTPAMQPRQQYNPATGQTETDAHALQMIDAALSAMTSRAAAPTAPAGNPAMQGNPSMAGNPAMQNMQGGPALQNMQGGAGVSGNPNMQNMQTQSATPGQAPGQAAGQGYSPYTYPSGQVADPRMNIPTPAEPVDPRMAAFDPRIAQQQPQMGYPAGRPPEAQPQAQGPMPQGGFGQPAQQGYPTLPGGRPAAQNPQMPSPAAQMPSPAGVNMQNQPMAGYPGAAQGPAQGAAPGSYPGGFESRMQTQSMAGEMTDYDPMSTRGYDPLAGYDQQPELPPGVGAYDPRTGMYPAGQAGRGAQGQPGNANPYAQAAQPGGAQPGGYTHPGGAAQGAFPQQTGGAYPAQMNPQQPQPGFGQPSYPGQQGAYPKGYGDTGYTGGGPNPDPYGSPYGDAQAGGIPPALIVVLCVLFPPAGLVLLFRRGSPFEGTMRMVLAVVGGLMTVLYIVLIYFLLSGSGAAQEGDLTPPDAVVTIEPSVAPPTAQPESTGSASISPTSSPKAADVQSYTSGNLVFSTTRVRLLTEKPKDKQKLKPKEGYAFLNVQCTIKNNGDKDESFKLDKAFTLEDLDANKIYSPLAYPTMTGTMPITAFNELVCEPYFEVPIGANHFQLNVRAVDGKEPFAFAVDIDPDQKPQTAAEAEPE